jgi:hypothetical protein
MRYIELYENYYGKRRKIPLEDKKILSDMSDIFIELTDKGFVRNTFIGVIGGSKLKEHNTDTLYLCIVKPKNIVQWRRGLEHEEGYDISLEDTGETMVSFFDTTYFDNTLELFRQSDVREYVLMFIDYMKGLWGEDIDVELKYDTISRKGIKDKEDNYYIDKYYVRIKKET